jgi:hypothetical protein
LNISRNARRVHPQCTLWRARPISLRYEFTTYVSHFAVALCPRVHSHPSASSALQSFTCRAQQTCTEYSSLLDRSLRELKKLCISHVYHVNSKAWREIFPTMQSENSHMIPRISSKILSCKLLLSRSEAIEVRDRQIYVSSAALDRSLLGVAAPTAVVRCSYAALLRSQTWDKEQSMTEVYHSGALDHLFCHCRRNSCTRLHRGSTRISNRRKGQAVSPRRLNRLRFQQSCRCVCRPFVMDEPRLLA